MRCPTMCLLGVSFVTLLHGSVVLSQTVQKRVLYVTHSAAFAHDVLPLSETVLTSLGETSGRFQTTVMRDVSMLDAATLATFDAVIFFTSGNLPLSAPQKQALLDFVAGGNAFVGIHSATDTFYDWPEYGRMLGGYFNGHPWVQSVGMVVEDAQHPAVAHLAPYWVLFDEIYQFRDWARHDVHVLMHLDPASVDLGAPGVDRPDQDFALAWTRTHGQGRVFYTALGHHASVWQDARFQQHLLGGIIWALDDEDRDGLTDRWESRFGLDPQRADGMNGGSGDPDDDGVSNRDEQQAGSHPRSFYTRYLAEGAASEFFETEIAIANPQSTDARVLVRFDRADGTTATHDLVVPSRRSAVVDVGTLPAMANAEFATTIESDVQVGVDRWMRWTRGRGYGAHAASSVAAPANRWLFAEGATHSSFDLFYLLENPAATDAVVDVRFLLPSGATVTHQYTVRARSRFTLWVNQIPGLEATDVSADVTVAAGPPIIGERAMYLSRPGRPFDAGHESAGVTAAATRWLLAEGATGPFFDMFVLVANATGAPAPLEVTYLLPDGSTLAKRYTVAANSRFNIWVNHEVVGSSTTLARTAVSVVVDSLDAVPIVAERVMWWPSSGAAWQEAHGAAGATTAGPRWLAAGGSVTDAPMTDTYLLVANTSATDAAVRVTLLFEDRAERSVSYVVGPNSRFTVDVRSQFPEAAGQRFAALVESVGASPAQIVVEESIYQDAEGIRWAAGANLLATRLDP